MQNPALSNVGKSNRFQSIVKLTELIEICFCFAYEVFYISIKELEVEKLNPF